MGLGGEDDADTVAHSRAGRFRPDVIGAITAVMRQEAFNHKNLQPMDGWPPTACR